MLMLHELTWIAGLLEGEGSFGIRNNRSKRWTPVIQIKMTDKDVIDKLGELINRKTRGPYNYSSNFTTSRKDVYMMDLVGPPAIKLMLALLPHMGERRAGKIREVVEYYNEDPPKGRGWNLKGRSGRYVKLDPREYVKVNPLMVETEYDPIDPKII